MESASSYKASATFDSSKEALNSKMQRRIADNIVDGDKGRFYELPLPSGASLFRQNLLTQHFIESCISQQQNHCYLLNSEGDLNASGCKNFFRSFSFSSQDSLRKTIFPSF